MSSLQEKIDSGDYEQEDLDNFKAANEHLNNFTLRYCGEKCGEDKELPRESWIDLEDGIGTKDNQPLYLKKNPSALLKNPEFHEFYRLCKLSYLGGHLPNQGGILDQDPEFLEHFEIYLEWKELEQKISKNGERK